MVIGAATPSAVRRIRASTSRRARAAKAENTDHEDEASFLVVPKAGDLSVRGQSTQFSVTTTMTSSMTSPSSWLSEQAKEHHEEHAVMKKPSVDIVTWATLATRGVE